MKRYIITSATPGCEPNYDFMFSLEMYAKKNKAQIIIIPTSKLYKKDELNDYFNDFLLFTDLDLNSNISISLMPINPEKVDPVAGLDRLSSDQHSTIYGSPKQRLKSVPSPSDDLPRVLMTPGSCTLPQRKNSMRSLVGAKDHVTGAIVVEVVNDKIFHFRQVQGQKDGSFVDWGKKYSPTGASKMETEAVIPGDWHTGYTDPVVRSAVIDTLKTLNPNYLFLHDLFDGISVNHHVENKLIFRSVLGHERRDLHSEIRETAVELLELQKHVKKKVVVVKSNHDEFLDRWLEEGKFLTDTENRITGLELALAKAKGQDPLEHGIRQLEKLDKVKFLRTDESFKITSKNIECGQHGHLGSNGARGSAAGLEKAYLRAIIGHSHSPEILRGLIVVGTSSYLKMSYNKGPSSWMQTFCIVYADGSFQLINVIDGKIKA